MEFRTLKETELEKWFYHCASVFGNNQNLDYWLDYFKRHYYNDPFKQVDKIFVAVDDNIIASTVRLFYRRIYFYGKEVTVGGIGEVSTKPEYRGMGLASKLLQMAIDTMKAEKFSLSILFASLHAFYEEFGYRIMHREFCVLDKEVFNSYYGLKDNQTREIKKIELSADIIENIEEIYKYYSANYHGPVIRNREYWLNWVKFEPKISLGYFIEGGLFAYLFYKKNGKEVIVLEFGCSESSSKETPLVELIKYIIQNEEVEKIRYPKVIEAMFAGCTELKDDSLMVKLITPFMVDNLFIDSTEKLINILSGEQNKFLFWGTDNF